MAVTVRTIQPDELGAWTRTMGLAFLEPAEGDEAAERWGRHLNMERTWAADDGGRIVGTCANLDRTVTLPGGRAVPFTAVSAVSVLPSHRRRGLLTRMMAELLADGRRRGEALAGLTASESVIYGRYGFGTATYAARYRLDADRVTLAVPTPEVAVDLVDAAEASKRIPELYARLRLPRAGEVDRTEAVWADVFADRKDHRDGGSANYYAVADNGYATYRVKEEDDDGHSLYGAAAHVRDLVGDSPETEAALWRWLCQVDFVEEVVAHPRPVDEPLRHRLADPRRLRTEAVTDRLWVRVLDTPACLEGRSYLREGSLTLDVTPAPVGADGDPAAGRWRLDAGPDGVTCRPAAPGEPTELRLGVAALGSLLMGGVRAATLAAAGRIGVERAGALDVADGLFATRPDPLTTTGF